MRNLELKGVPYMVTHSTVRSTVQSTVQYIVPTQYSTQYSAQYTVQSTVHTVHNHTLYCHVKASNTVLLKSTLFLGKMRQLKNANNPTKQKKKALRKKHAEGFDLSQDSISE